MANVGLYMRIRLVLFSAFIVALVGCVDPYDYKIPADMEKWKSDEALRTTIEKLKPEDKEVLARYMLGAGMRQAFGQPTSELSIRDAVAAQRKREAENAAKEAEEKALAERVKKEREEAIAKMNTILTVAMTGLSFHDADWRNGVQDGFAVSFAFQNKTERDLAGVKGTVRFADMFDDEIKQVNLSMDEAIPAGQTVTWRGELGFNQFIEDDKKLRNTAVDKLKVSWIPTTYLFTDGTRMDAPQ